MEHLLPLFVTWDVNPALLHIGSFEIRYYGLLWAIALGISAYIFHNIMQREGLSEKTFDSIFCFGVISTVVGALLGHCLFYDPGYYLTHPIEILDIRQGGWPATAPLSVCCWDCGSFRARIKCLISGRSTASVLPWRSAGWPSGWET